MKNIPISFYLDYSHYEEPVVAFILLGGFIYLIVRPNKTKKKAVLEGELSEEIAVTNENNED